MPLLSSHQRVATILETIRIEEQVREVDKVRAAKRLLVRSESTFCRAFEEFAKSGLVDRTLETAVKTHLGRVVVHHVSHDSTAIPGRERGPKKEKRPNLHCHQIVGHTSARESEETELCPL